MKKIDLIFYLVLIGLAVYCVSLFGNFVWDDEDFVNQNKYVADFQIVKFFTQNSIAGRGKISNYYRPLQLTINSAVKQVFGFNPLVFHAVTILFHITASIFVYLFILELLTRQQKPPPDFSYIKPKSRKYHPSYQQAQSEITKASNFNHLFSFLVAIFFLIHPAQTEAVSYVSGMPDCLFVTLMFLSLLLYLQKKWWISIIVFFLSLLAKELGIVTLAIIILIEIFFNKEKERRNWPIVAIFIAVGAIFMISRVTFLQFQDTNSLWKGMVWGNNIAIRIANFFQIFFIYLNVLFYPKELFMERDYSYSVINQIFNIWELVFTIFLTVVSAIVYYLDQLKLIKLNQTLFFGLGFLASLLPFSGIMLINGIIYEHYLYLPIIFFFGFIFSLIEKILDDRIILFLLIIVAGLFVVRSWARQYQWIDNVRFYEDTLSHAPTSVRILNNLGMEYANRNNFNKAVEYYQKGIAISPKTPNFYHNLANTYASQNKMAEAEKNYLTAIGYDKTFSYSYYGLLNLYLKTNQKDKAMIFLITKALVQFPKDPQLTKLKEELQKTK